MITFKFASPQRLASTRASFDLERLIAPIEVGAFWDSHWEQRPLIVSRSDPDYYGDLLSLADADEILAYSSVNSLDLRVVRDGRNLPVAECKRGSRDALGLESTYAAYRDGATIVVQFLELRHQSVRSLSQSLTQDLSAGVHVNVYITPPNAHALQTHFDTHDVFVVQAYGSKRWRIYDSPIRLPLQTQAARRRVADARLGAEPSVVDTQPNSFHEFTLHQGDMVYIPRGFLHDAASTDSPSIHLTVGITPVTWLSAIVAAVEMMGERDVRFREALRPGFAHSQASAREMATRLRELVEVALEGLPAEDAIDWARLRVTSSTPPSLDGHLTDLEAEPRITLRTVVRRRQDIISTLSGDSNAVRLTFHGKVLRMAVQAEAALAFIVSADEFVPADLPGRLSDAARLVLVRRLVREGLLTIS